MQSQVPALTQEDQDHLKILSICYKVYGVLTALMSCFALIHICMGLAMVFNPDWFNSSSSSSEAVPPFLGWFFFGIGSIVLLAGWTMGIFNWIAGNALKNRARRTLILVMAGLNCLNLPLGTILGVFTFVVVSRPQIKQEFLARIGPRPR